MHRCDTQSTKANESDHSVFRYIPLTSPKGAYLTIAEAHPRLPLDVKCDLPSTLEGKVYFRVRMLAIWHLKEGVSDNRR